jgi:hypothetical protein
MYRHSTTDEHLRYIDCFHNSIDSDPDSVFWVWESRVRNKEQNAKVSNDELLLLQYGGLVHEGGPGGGE